MELAHITICGDRPEDMEAQLRFMAEQGVGPGDHQRRAGPHGGRPHARGQSRASQAARSHLDEELEGRIADILEPLMKRWQNLDFDAVRAANRKQALVPRGRDGDRAGRHRAGDGGAPSRRRRPDGGGPARPAPRAARHVARRRSRPRRSGRRSAPPATTAVDAAAVRHPRVGDRRDAARRGGGDRRLRRDLEITTCLRRGEVEVVVRHEPAAEGAWTALEGLIAAPARGTRCSPPTARPWTSR